jgi:predicted nucleic acid-binding protein
MAGNARYTALLDANVLYPMLLRDLLLSLAHADLYNAKWSVHIREELTRNLLKNFPDISATKVAQLTGLMETATPDCLVTGYEHLIEAIHLPDPTDRHVLAAAIAGRADAIVTSNQKDFPRNILEDFDIELQTPDEFVVNQLMLKDSVAVTAIKRMRQRWARPEITAFELIKLLEKRELPLTAAHLEKYVELI